MRRASSLSSWNWLPATVILSGFERISRRSQSAPSRSPGTSNAATEAEPSRRPDGRRPGAERASVPQYGLRLSTARALPRFGPSGSPLHRGQKKQRHQDGQQQAASVRHAFSFVSCEARRQWLKPRPGAPRCARARGAEASFPVPSGARAMRLKDAAAG